MKNTKRLNKKAQVEFFRELGELLDAGYSLDRALDILKLSHVRWSALIERVQFELEDGRSFYDALKGRIDTKNLLSIQIAQQHGQLATGLIQLGQVLGQLSRQSDKLRQVMRYPMILLSLLLCLLLALQFFLFPILNQWQQSQGQATGSQNGTWLLTLSLLCGASIFAAFAAFLYWRRQSRLNRVRLLAKLPILGTLTKLMVTYQVTAQLALMAKVGLNLPAIIDELAEKPGEDFTKELAQKARVTLAAGQGIEAFILQENYLDSALAGYFLRGLKAEVLSDYLNYYAKQQFSRFMIQTDRLIGILQPLFFCVIGVAIVGMYLSMLLPMYHSLGGMYS
ncbi:type II secretion system F family protein [Eupransor demetentiae]|uniref:Component PulF (PulF) n=1 Tax=Eupransor demetentiae TaxID=3109584 RepID=A0ABP0EP83_9LACO|nr:Type II secretory pathway [Lactobacillaceae bacterium LMG 33000]